MQNLSTRIPALLFAILALILYKVSAWVMIIFFIISWGFLRVPKLFPNINSIDDKNKKTGFIILLILISMSVFSYLMVPLFHQMCHALDIGGKVHSFTGTVLENKNVSYSKNEAYPVITLYSGTPLKIDLSPKSNKIPVNANFQHLFILTNTQNKPNTIRLKLTLAPSNATNYIKEITSFNNGLIKFKPYEKKSIIVKFYADALPKDIPPSVAMSYTFFKNKA